MEHHFAPHQPSTDDGDERPTAAFGQMATSHLSQPVEHPHQHQHIAGANEKSAPVVHVLSVRGLEYKFMALLLWLVAGSFAWILLTLINGETGFEALSMPAALLLVCVPGFAFFFTRLKKAELADPALRFDSSKRRISQFTQFFAFLVALLNIIAFVYQIMQSIAGEEVGSLLKLFGSTLVILAVSGGMFAYYWFDEHRSVK